MINNFKSFAIMMILSITFNIVEKVIQHYDASFEGEPAWLVLLFLINRNLTDNRRAIWGEPK